MQRDLQFATFSDEHLELVMKNAIHKLGEHVGRTYDERQAIALTLCRVLVEMKIRDHEKELAAAVELLRDSDA